MPQSFQPHQLDYDWRFDSDSQSRIADLAVGSQRVVLLGCPSLSNALADQVEMGVLLERNPNHYSTNQFTVHHCDLRDRTTLPQIPYKFDLGIVDAPWYIDDLLAWLNVALSAIDVGKTVLFVLWPESTRPAARTEHQIIWSALKSVGEFEQIGTISYDTPLFEKRTLQEAGVPTFLRLGLLVKLTKRKSITLAAKLNCGPGLWKRFGIGETQVAIKITAKADLDSDAFAFSGPPFVLRTTSRRDPSLAKINIWTSENVVGQLKNPTRYASGLSEGLPTYVQFLNRLFKLDVNPLKEAQVMAWEHLE